MGANQSKGQKDLEQITKDWVKDAAKPKPKTKSKKKIHPISTDEKKSPPAISKLAIVKRMTQQAVAKTKKATQKAGQKMTQCFVREKKPLLQNCSYLSQKQSQNITPTLSKISAGQKPKKKKPKKALNPKKPLEVSSSKNSAH
jgi:hypothetical protein